MKSLLRTHVKVPLWAIFTFLIIIFMAFSNMKLLIDSQSVLVPSLDNYLREEQTSTLGSTLSDETNVKIPTYNNGVQMTLEERVRYLELKVNSYIGFGTDPFFGVEQRYESSCRKKSNLLEFGCESDHKEDCFGDFDHNICLDGLPGYELEGQQEQKKEEDGPPCLVYDFGIREQPQFGQVMAEKFGCEVHGFDPSPVSIKWWKSEDEVATKLRENSNYHFHPYGAGGTDGQMTLKEYNWGQVSILRFPTWIVKCKEGTTNENCDLENHEFKSKGFQLPVKTLPTIMKELGHEGRTIDILKIDVEGSEYAFLEHLLDSTAGCPEFIQQVTLEWHHFPLDVRYGEGASPPINVIATLLHTCGLKNVDQFSHGGWPSADKVFQDLGMKDVRYNLATFYREPKISVEKK